MTKYDLPFAKIILLREDIAEVIINEGIEMDLKMVDDYHAFLISHLTAPFSLLVNKVNSYSYNAEAQEKLGTIKEINSMAVVSYKKSTTITTQDVASFPRDIDWNMRIFSTRDDALVWLKSKQEAFAK